MALLNDEAHVSAVTDPAGCAWAVARLTATSAWQAGTSSRPSRAPGPITVS